MSEVQELIEPQEEIIDSSICHKAVAILLLIYVSVPIVFTNIYFWCKDIEYNISAEMYCLCNGILFGFFCLVAIISILVTSDFRYCFIALSILFYVLVSVLNIIWLVLILKR